MNRLTVLLPVRDAAPTLDRALTSLWRQTHDDFQVIAVDDGSTDATPDILAAHARRDPRLTVRRTSPQGIVAALEAARAEANTEFLARMDADDIAHPQRFALQLALLETQPRTAALGCRVAKFHRRNLGAGWRRYQRWLNGLITAQDHTRELFVESPLAHPSVILRARAVHEIGGYRDMPWAEDYDLWLRLHAAGWQLAKHPRTLLAWRHGAQRLSVRSDRYTPNAFLAARAHFLARHPALHNKQIMLSGLGRTGRRLARLLAEDGITITRAFTINRARVGSQFRHAPVHSWLDLPPASQDPLIVAVGAPGARNLIRPEVLRKGYVEGENVFFVG